MLWGECVLDEISAVVGLLEAEGLVGEGAHHPSGVAMGIGFDGELVADLVVVLGCPLLAEVVVLPTGEVGEFGDGSECSPSGSLIGESGP